MKLRRGKLANRFQPPRGATLAVAGGENRAAQQTALLLPMSPPRMRTAIHQDSELLLPSSSQGPRSTARSSRTPLVPLNPEREIYLIPKIGGG
jgi:hypothetical protein